MTNQKQTMETYKNIKYPKFVYTEYGVKGVGKNRNPIISMDKFIDHSEDENLHYECCKGLAITNDTKFGMIYGSLPPEEELRLHGHKSWTDVLDDLRKDIVLNKKHLDAIEYVISKSQGNEIQAIYKYCYFALGAAIPWFFAVYLKRASFANKAKDVGVYTETSMLFPNVIKYIETLPFKHVGRILFFTTYPNAGVITHRDSVVEEHKDHNLNLFFDGGWRPSFVWDEIKKEKIYLPKGAKSYFFNNRDYHGVDAEPTFRYTLRIDGTFTDELCSQLGLEEGYTWKWKYEKE